MLRTTAIVASTLLLATGCGRKDVIRPSAEVDPYRSFRKTDPLRTGDLRRDPILDMQESAPEQATREPEPEPVVAAIRPGDTLGTLVTVGAVVADVNGTPIYAHELVRDVMPALRPRAASLRPEAFRRLATTELVRQRDARIQDELIFAAAERNTTDDERRRAELLTASRFEKLVTAAGGSRAEARRRAEAEGDDWDRMLSDEYRRNLVGIYYTRRVFPRAASSIDEMRRYYERAKLERFTSRSAATFQLIRIDIRDAGSEDEARTRIEALRARVAAGEDFVTLANQTNRNQLLLDRNAQLGPINRDTYPFEAVEAAIWATPVGGITEIVQERNAFFLARVVAKTEGVTQPFDDPQVQAAINTTLRDAKMNEIQRRETEILRREAIINATPAMLAPAVDMAMQIFDTWVREAEQESRS
jgi:parvulin-like peptidyl-prolyl isomerase